MPVDAQQRATPTGHDFGTAPVFLASISTILGAVLFLRFGYAVGHQGVGGTFLIILLGHLVTIPTALAIAEIATNRRVEGGGEYFIISRSFGSTIGGSIGISLYFSQAISVAFYMIALAEAFRPLAPWFEQTTGIAFDPRLVSLPATALLAVVVIFRGASLGVKALWVVVVVLGVSLAAFSVGSPVPGAEISGFDLFARVPGADPFMIVFAIVFPAFTGITAGVGLSGDLANPRRSIPRGILAATLTGLVVYLLIVVKLALSATPEMLAGEPLIMSRIAIWGPIIPIGLAAATVSSAIGSILVAPRTLQALGGDGLLGAPPLNRLLSRGVGEANEPRNATLLTAALALAIVAIGNIDYVARIISMFFMVTYGALCAISFLEHFAARPSYRPAFRSRWYLSLIGAAACVFLMFQMDPLFALLAIAVMVVLYRTLRARRGGTDDLAAIFQGVITQANRYSQLRLQRSLDRHRADEWRPAVVMVNGRTFDRAAPVQFFGWLAHRYGFGTYLHFIEGRLDADTYRQSRKILPRLVRQFKARGSGIYADTMISPSMRTAVAQTLQVPGTTGMENNSILFEFDVDDAPEVLAEIEDGCSLAFATQTNVLVLRHCAQFFGARSTLHIWITWHDETNGNLLILLAYILLGHPDWKNADVRVFVALPKAEVPAARERLDEMVAGGRLPISAHSVRIIGTEDDVDFEALVRARSSRADLVLLGFTEKRLQEKGTAIFQRHPSLSDVVFVAARERIEIE